MAKLTKAQWNARRDLVQAIDLPASGFITVELAGTTLKLPVMLRDFAKGSRGYHVADRLQTEHGLFQMNVTITQIGSGPYTETEAKK